MEISNEQLYNKIIEFEKTFTQVESYGVEDTAGYKNLIAVKDYTVKTRKMFNELKETNESYKKQLIEQKKLIDSLKDQITKLQIKIYQNNSTV